MESWSWSAWTSVGLAIQGVYPLFSPSKNLWYVKTVLSWVHSYLNHNITLHSSFILIYLMGLSGNWVLTPNSSGQSPFSRIKWVSWIILVVKAVKSPILRRHVTALHLRNRSSIWRSWAPAASGKLDALEKVKSHAKQDCETTWNNHHRNTLLKSPDCRAIGAVQPVQDVAKCLWGCLCVWAGMI